MSYWSDKAIEKMECPNLGQLDTYVCSECVVDEALVDLVTANLQENECSYCGKLDDSPCAAPFNVIMERIFSAISTCFSDAQDIDLPWVDGGWITEEVYREEIIAEFDPGWDGPFVTDVIECLDPSAYWTEHSNGDWAISNPSETLRYGWEGFKNQVLTRTRYLFLSEPEDKSEFGRPDYLPISRMLDALGHLVNKHSLVRTFDPGAQSYFRVRVSTGTANWSEPSDFGVPPQEKSSAGRMNPAGIPYFYVAMDEQTSIAEVIYNPVKYYVAMFQAILPVRLLDLTDLPTLPSLFLPELYDERHELLFLREFLDDITQPIVKDGREHVDYVPTQIVSEFFRHRYRGTDGEGIDGIMYPSVKNIGGTNIVIFASSNDELSELFQLVEFHESNNAL